MKKGESSGLGVKEPKMYFGDKQQEAVIKYKYSTNQKERDSVYTKILHKPFMQMTAAIIRRYPIHIGRYYMEDLECMALSHLIENFENFDEWKPDRFKLVVGKDKKDSVELESLYHIRISTDKEGVIKSFENGNLNGYLIVLIENKMVGQKTVYISENMDVFLNVTEQEVSRKKVYVIDFSIGDFEINKKNLVSFYFSKNPLLTETDVYDRIKKFKKALYIPIFEERKAFSYCQTIIRNFLKDHSKKTYHKQTTEIQLEYPTYDNDFDEDIFGYYEIEIPEITENEEEDVYLSLFKDITKNLSEELATNEFLNEQEKLTGDSLLYILNNWTKLYEEESYNGYIQKKTTETYLKKKFFLLLSERSKLPVKKLKQNMKHFESLYKLMTFFIDDKKEE